MNCNYCNRTFTTKSGVSLHSKSCKNNPDRVPGFWESEAYKKQQSDIRKSQPPLSEETRKKISETTIKNQRTPEYRAKQSLRMKQAVLDHPDSYSDKNVVGRSKHFEVNGVRFNSTWEYIVAQYLDLHNIKWTRKGIKPIPYLWNDSWHLYFPDFLIETADIYIEVKGYETERDRVKWKYSDKPVLVIKKKEVDSINNNLYNVQEEINKCSGSQAVKAPTS